MRSHEIVESALDRCSVDAMTVICQEHSSTNLRWASNTLTTNGVMRSRDVTVVAISGGAAGVASASVADADDLGGIVERAEAAAHLPLGERADGQDGKADAGARCGGAP